MPATRPLLVRPWLVPLALICQVAGVYVLPAGDGALLRRLCLAAAYAMLLYVVWLNRHLWGVRVLAIGLLLNAAALAAGHGLMPVTAQTMHEAGLDRVVATVPVGSAVPHSKDVLVAPPSAAIAWLIDSIPVSNSAMHYAMSPGDAVILAGVVVSLIELAAVVRLGAGAQRKGVPALRGRAANANG